MEPEAAPDFSDADRLFMQQALTLAAQAEASGEVPVGALLVRDGVVVGEGWNQPITAHDPTAHAEIVALRDAAARAGNYRLPGSTLYVTLEPCSMCAGAIVHARVERLVYAAAEAKAGVAGSNGCFFHGDFLNHRVLVEGGLLASDSSQRISAFFARRRAEKKALKRQAGKNTPDAPEGAC